MGFYVTLDTVYTTQGQDTAIEPLLSIVAIPITRAVCMSHNAYKCIAAQYEVTWFRVWRFRWFIFILQNFFSFLVAFVTRTSLLRGDELSMSKEIHYSSYMHEQDSV